MLPHAATDCRQSDRPSSDDRDNSDIGSEPDPAAETLPCETCDGDGWFESADDEGMPDPFTIPCGLCTGTGRRPLTTEESAEAAWTRAAQAEEERESRRRP